MNTRLLLLFCSSVAVAACSNDAPPDAAGASSGSNGAPVTPGGGPPRLFPERLCEPLPQRSSDIEEVAVPAAIPPAHGGAIYPGTYMLTEVEAYGAVPNTDPLGPHGEPGVSKTGRVARATLYVTNDALRFNEARGEGGPLPPEDKTRGYSYRVEGETLQLLAECPQRGATSTMKFYATKNMLVLYPDANHREVYMRVPLP